MNPIRHELTIVFASVGIFIVYLNWRIYILLPGVPNNRYATGRTIEEYLIGYMIPRRINEPPTTAEYRCVVRSILIDVTNYRHVA